MITHNFSVLAENAFTDNQSRLSIIQIFEEISSSSFPTIHPRIVAVSSYISDKKENRAISFIARIVSPNEKVIQELKIKAPLDVGKINFLSEFSSTIFEDPGLYSIIFTIDDEVQKELTLKLTKRE